MEIPAALERPSEQTDGEAAAAADQERAIAIAIARATEAKVAAAPAYPAAGGSAAGGGVERADELELLHKRNAAKVCVYVVY